MDEGSAFERLWREEYRHVVRTAFLMTGSPGEAEDLAQEAFAVAWRKWRHVGSLQNPGAWVQVTVGKLCLNWLRRQKFRERTIARLAGDANAAGARHGPAEADPALAEALDALTPAQRTVLVLRYYADLRADEVARVLRKRPGTVRALTSQALTSLRLAFAQVVARNET